MYQTLIELKTELKAFKISVITSKGKVLKIKHENRLLKLVYGFHISLKLKFGKEENIAGIFVSIFAHNILVLL